MNECVDRLFPFYSFPFLGPFISLVLSLDQCSRKTLTFNCFLRRRLCHFTGDWHVFQKGNGSESPDSRLLLCRILGGNSYRGKRGRPFVDFCDCCRNVSLRGVGRHGALLMFSFFLAQREEVVKELFNTLIKLTVVSLFFVDARVEERRQGHCHNSGAECRPSHGICYYVFNCNVRGSDTNIGLYPSAAIMDQKKSFFYCTVLAAYKWPLPCKSHM